MRDSLARYRPGDSLHFRASIKVIKPVFPKDIFDYDRYLLLQKNIRYRLFPEGRIIRRGRKNTPYFFLQTVRSRLLRKTDTLISDTASRMLVKALCLGYKNDLDPEIKNTFVKTGTIHLLAVSGLHTGAVYLLLGFLLRLTGINNRYLHLALLPVLWMYAGITGLSPSVIRAAQILSFITIGRVFVRDYSPVNCIAASAFFTLLFQPHALYSISMQMSYAAYTGIILLYPLCHKTVSRFPKLIRPVGSLLCISLSAQLATFPLSIYYFHFFSLSGFLINIPAVPLATLLLYTSLILLILPYAIGLYHTFIVVWLCQGLLLILLNLSGLSLYLDTLYPSFLTVIFLYLTFFTLYGSIKRKKYFPALGISLCLLSGSLCWNNYRLSHIREITVFHFRNRSCILLHYNGFYGFPGPAPDSFSRAKIAPYILRHKLKPLPEGCGILSKNFTCIPGNTSRFSPSLHIPGPEYASGLSASIWIITDNRQPPALTDSIPNFPTSVILDASNAPYSIRAWEKFCGERSISLKKTSELGHIRISLE